MSPAPVWGIACLWLATACVDTTKEGNGNGQDSGPEPIVLIDTDPVPPAVRDDSPTGPYAWRNVVIKGGGFVTGIVFSQAAPNLVYARTDVGGAYRFDLTGKRWMPLLDWVGQSDSNLMGIESVAADPVDPRRVYLAAGTYLTAGSGVMLRSEDYGKTWTRGTFGGSSVPMGGNTDGRSMGERLMVDPNQPSVLYFGSRNGGLWRSVDSAATWQAVTSFPVMGDANLGLSFVLFDGPSGSAGVPTPTLYVGVATLTGNTLYRTSDAGASFAAVPGAPTGMVPHHGALAADGMLYVVYADGPGPSNIATGALWRHDTASGQWTDVSPVSRGLGGLTVDASRPGTLMVSTMNAWPGEIYRSTDAGEHWAPLRSKSRLDPMGAKWLYFGGGSLDISGWMGDLEIDPWNRSRVLFITGQGIWWSDDVTQADANLPTNWSFRDDGLEETVALDLVSPPAGAELLSGLGDVGGFRHDDFLTTPAAGMFTNPVFGNTSSLDFAEANPAIVVRVGRVNQSQGTPRHGAISLDGGTTWRPFASEPGSQGEGSIAISADGLTLVWSPRGTGPAVSRDFGESWTPCTGDLTGSARLAADRVNPNRFYATRGTTLYVSSDGGTSFAAVTAVPSGARPRTPFGIEGDVWLVAASGLLHSTDAGVTVTPLGSVGAALGLGFGQAAPGQTYPALYLAGTVNGVAGLFRSDDTGQTFVVIDDPQHRFGWSSVITGDPRRYGRVYVGTGGRGIVHGDPL
jgi:hypothetical protein